jgi:hypothetical protein
MSLSGRPKVVRYPDGKTNSDAWWYESRYGIEVVHDVRDSAGQHIRFDGLRIGWTALLDAAQRSCRREEIIRRKVKR